MIPQSIYCENLGLVDEVKGLPGAIVECGTWKGGMIAGIALIVGDEKEYLLFDSFEGLPPAKEINCDRAIEWQADTNSPGYYDNCTASEESAHRDMKFSGVSNVSIVKGWFNETLPSASIADGIAVLRMDADWYDSTMEILNSLFHQVNTCGIIIIDDYYVWDGCSKAVHDFLSQLNRAERI
jgi:O-methyltransferase